MTPEKLTELQASLADARLDSGYSKGCFWAMQNGTALLDEITRLRTIIRVNALRNGASPDQINETLDA